MDTPAGEDWFLHFQDKGAYGRVVHLQPLVWHDDWPVIGDDSNGDGKGQPYVVHAKPALASQPFAAPATSDNFSAPVLGPQWQWQANPVSNWYSLSARPGCLRLLAQPAPESGDLYGAPFLLLQKMPAEEFAMTTKVELNPKAEGDRAGLVVFGQNYAWIGLERSGGATALVRATCLGAASGAPEQGRVLLKKVAGPIFLRVTVSAGAKCRFAWSADGQDFTTIDEGEFTATAGRWVGAKVGLFAAGTAGASADFAGFHVAPAPR